MTLIENWQKAYKLFSVQAMAIATAIITTWASIPDDTKIFFPLWVTNTVHWSSAVILVLGIIGRVVTQNEAAADATLPPPTSKE